MEQIDDELTDPATARGSTAGQIRLTALVRTAALRFGDRPATVDIASRRSRSWRELGDRIPRIASGLQSLGISRAGRVAVLGFNSDYYFESFFAVPYAGGVIVPVNFRFAPPEIIHVLSECEVSVLLVDKTFSPMLQALIGKVPSLKKVVYLGDDALPQGCDLSFASLAGAHPCEDALRGGNDVAGIFYTGGTTGRAKGVMLTHANLVLNAMGNSRAWTHEDSYLHGAPMFHLANGAGMLSTTYVAGRHVFIPAFAPDAFLKAISSEKVSRAMAVPAMITAMVALPGIKTMDLSSLKQITYGASPMSETLLKEAMAAFPNAEFMQGYGMTECAPGITNLEWQYHLGPHARLRSVGKACPYLEIKIADALDREVPRGTVGEVLVRGPNVMKGYFKNPDATSEALRGGWMHTGDGAYMDKDGFVFLVDRMKDMIITGGENVYSAEVENVVMSYPGVAMCAVIGTPDQKLGELVTVIVQPKESAKIDVNALQEHCRAHIAAYKIPRKVVVQDTLPMSGAGKVLKAELRKPFWKNSDIGGLQAKL